MTTTSNNLTPEQEQLEIAHEQDMAQAAVERYEHYANFSADRNMAGDVDDFGHLIRKSILKVEDIFWQEVDRFKRSGGKGRPSAIQNVFDGAWVS